MKKDYNILLDSQKNQGLAFDTKQRELYELYGLLPIKVRSLEEQVEAQYEKLKNINGDYHKHLELMNIYSFNKTLFFKLVESHVKEFLPIIYTPTIAQAVMDFSTDFLKPYDAIYINAFEKEKIKIALHNGTKNKKNIDLAIITDGEGVLGIGDWGVNGVMISVGKTAVYSIAAGISPERMLAIVVDNGTNRKELLNNKYYVGNKKERQTGEKYYEVIDILIEEITKLFPNCFIHFEDFGRGNAATLLKRYQNNYCAFNDDIEGTGIMMNAAVSSVSSITKKHIKNMKFVIFGAGTAGVGIANQLLEEIKLSGLDDKTARNNFFLIDRNGLILDNMNDLTQEQKEYAKNANDFNKEMKDLKEIINTVKPDVLIGCSGQTGKFTNEVIEAMSKINEHPAIMPISNPTSLCEATAKDIINISKGKALVVTGSPSDPVEFNGTKYFIGQANNALLYPGFGLGVISCKAKRITQGMLSSAAHAISEIINLDKVGSPLLPPVSEIRRASKAVAVAVVKTAIKENISTIKIDDPQKTVDQNIINFEYEK